MSWGWVEARLWVSQFRLRPFEAALSQMQAYLTRRKGILGPAVYRSLGSSFAGRICSITYGLQVCDPIHITFWLWGVSNRNFNNEELSRISNKLSIDSVLFQADFSLPCRPNQLRHTPPLVTRTILPQSSVAPPFYSVSSCVFLLRCVDFLPQMSHDALQAPTSADLDCVLSLCLLPDTSDLIWQF